MPDSAREPPPPDLDVPAARQAASLFQARVAAGVGEGDAWAEAVALFALHHPAWPLPLAEREAALAVGALLARERCDACAPVRHPPPELLRPLLAPARPDAESARVALLAC